MNWDAGSDTVNNAGRVLPRVAGRYFAAGRTLLNDAAAPAAMHAFRLKTKRLRYTLELFREIYGPGLDTRLAALREVQTILGDLNDCATVATLAPEAREFLDARAAKLTTKFRRHWTKVFDAPGQEKRWQDYLGHPRSKRK